LQIGKTYKAKPADIWGLGILQFMLLTGRFPFFGANPPELARRIRLCKFGFSSADRVSRPARMLAHCLIRLHPGERPLAEEILMADWLEHPVEVSNTDATFFTRSSTDLEEGGRGSISAPVWRASPQSALDRHVLNASRAEVRVSMETFVSDWGREMGPSILSTNGDLQIVPGECSVRERGGRDAIRVTVAQP